MTAARCPTPIPVDSLLAYWLDELDETAQIPLEEHLLGCSACAAELQELVALGAGIRRLAGHGSLRAIVSAEFVQRLAGHGLRLREYRVPRNGSVHCTVAPQDDVVVARLEAPLADVARLDLVVFDLAGTGHTRLEDLPFDAQAGELVFTPDAGALRALPRITQRMQLVAVEPGAERLLGEYTFHHSPWGNAG